MKVTAFISALLLGLLLSQELIALEGPTEEDLQRLFDEAEKAEQENKPAEKVEKKKVESAKPQTKPVKKIKKYHLTINTKPAEAKVQITNIKPKYKAGIRLEPSAYTIKVTKAGYYPVKKTVTIRNSDVTKTIRLKKKPVEQPKPKKAISTPQSNVKPLSTPTKQSGKSKHIDHGDGTVTDTKTGLMWKKCSEGQYGNNCAGKAKEHKWNDAMKRFKRVSFAGYDDWRIPKKEELRTLVYCSNGKKNPTWENGGCSLDGSYDYHRPTLNVDVFPNISPFRFYLWSSSTIHDDYGTYAYILLLDSGSFNRSNITGSGKKSVRLVRGNTNYNK